MITNLIYDLNSEISKGNILSCSNETSYLLRFLISIRLSILELIKRKDLTRAKQFIETYNKIKIHYRQYDINCLSFNEKEKQILERILK